MMKRLLWMLAASGALTWAQAPVPVPAPSGSRQAANIELTVYLLSGVAQGETADDVPQDLVSTVKQLRSIFNYKSYKLTESFMLRGRVGTGAKAAGILPGGAGMNYEFQYGEVRVSSETPALFRITGLRIELTRPHRVGGQNVVDTVASIHTDLDIREGQKTVVGKSSVTSTGDALILVIVPKLAE